MNEYTVEFRIVSEDLVPASITGDLGLQPTITRLRRNDTKRTDPSKTFVWGYDGFTSDRRRAKGWPTLGEGLEFLLKKLTPLKNKIDAYKTKYEVFFWCGRFQDSNFESSTELSPEILKSLGDFGVKVLLSTYVSETGAQK